MDVILDNPEGKPETIAWRNSRLALWSKIRERRDADFASAARFTSADKARDYAMQRARGEVQIFLAEVLRRASATGAAQFLTEAPFGWYDRPEILLDTGELIPRLIRRSYPSVTYAAKLQELEKQKAKIDTYWGPWIRNWVEVTVQETGVQLDAAAKVVGDAYDTAKKTAEYAGLALRYGPPVLLGAGLLFGTIYIVRRL